MSDDDMEALKNLPQIENYGAASNMPVFRGTPASAGDGFPCARALAGGTARAGGRDMHGLVPPSVLCVVIFAAAAAHAGSAGQVDATFAIGGRVPTARPFGVARQVDGKLLVNLSQDSLARYLPDGSLDTSFGVGGTAAVPFWGQIVVQPDGRILVAGNGYPDGEIAPTMLVARYLSDGTPDPGFGTDGVAAPASSFGSVSLVRGVLQPDGGIVSLGQMGRRASTGRRAVA